MAGHRNIIMGKKKRKRSKKTEKSNLKELASVTKVVEKRIAWVIHLQVSACLFAQALDACVRKWTRT